MEIVYPEATMQIAKWGNSLAIRIPADVVRELGLKEGDDVSLHALSANNVAVVLESQRRAAILARISELSVAMPADFRFDREEANAR